jgi:hypothetical protein
MKPSTSTIPIDPNELATLRTARIVAAFINALPPRSGELHGTSIELFFENGASCSIDGAIIDVAPKEEAYSLHIGKAMQMAVWQRALLEATEDPVIKTIDLHALWSEQGLELLLGGPREVHFYRRAANGPLSHVRDRAGFEAIRLDIPGSEAQSILFYASEDFPGDVVIVCGVPVSKFKNLVEVSPIQALSDVLK